MSNIWIHDPTILFQKDNLSDFFYKKESSLEENINALTRLIMYMTILSYIAGRSTYLVVYGFIGIIILVLVYFFMKTRKTKVKTVSEEEAFQNPEYIDMISKNYTMPTQDNPIMNVLQNEYTDNPDRQRAAPAYTKEVSDDINRNVRANLDPKLFKNIGDEIDFEHSMRSFYTTANSNIPNDQQAFIDFCYGNMDSCKEGAVLQCEKKNFRYNLR